MYGTTEYGGTNGDGTVFKLAVANNYALTTLATFNGINGSLPLAGLIADPAGNLYGTTYSGGANNFGTAFKLRAANNYAVTTLATFRGISGIDGAAPRAALIADAAGNLYGTTAGVMDSIDGTAFKLDAANNYARPR